MTLSLIKNMPDEKIRKSDTKEIFSFFYWFSLFFAKSEQFIFTKIFKKLYSKILNPQLKRIIYIFNPYHKYSIKNCNIHVFVYFSVKSENKRFYKNENKKLL